MWKPAFGIGHGIVSCFFDLSQLPGTEGTCVHAVGCAVHGEKMAPCMQQLPAVVVKLFPYRFFFLLPPLNVSCCGPLLAGQKHMCEEHFHFTVRDRYLFFPPQSDIQPQKSKLGATNLFVLCLLVKNMSAV